MQVRAAEVHRQVQVPVIAKAPAWLAVKWLKPLCNIFHGHVAGALLPDHLDQHSLGSRSIATDESKAVWVAKPESGKGAYIGLFNLKDDAQTIQYPLQALGLPGTSFRVRDLWAKKDLGSTDTLKATLQPHASVLYRLQ